MARIIAVTGKNVAKQRKEFNISAGGADVNSDRINTEALREWIETERITVLRFELVCGRGCKTGPTFTIPTPIRPVVDADELTATVQGLEDM